MPHESTVAEIRDTYVQAWKMGLKCVAIYRDGSKRSQPLNTRKTTEGVAKSNSDTVLVSELSARIKELEATIAHLEAESGKPLRRRLPDTRTALTHKFDIAGHEGYLTVGLFDDGRPGELFITMSKEGSTIGGLMDSIGTLTSLAWQYGVPLEALVKKFAHQRFEPSGFTKNPEIRSASSITDYVFRWMALQFVPGYRESMQVVRNQPDLAMPGLAEEIKKNVNRPVPELLPLAEENDVAPFQPASHHERRAATLTQMITNQQDAPSCPNCGQITVRNGACYKCLNCGESLGCS
jgi:ribonucleoside-diphosphate reductase alpha chain